jgi:transposase
MPVVGGLDIHRKQVTFDYLDTATGEVKRGQIVPADRAHLRSWLARFAGRDDVAFALEGCTGWRYVSEELAGAGVVAHVAEPADTAFARGRKRHAKTGKTDSRHLRELLAEGRLPECWIPPSYVLECRALLEIYHDLRAGHTAWVQRIHTSVFPSGRSGPERAAHRARHRGSAGGCRLSPVAGRAAAGGHRAGHAHLPGGAPGGAAAPAAGRCPVPDQGEGARCPAVRGRPGHRAGADLLAGEGRFSSSRKAVRFAGLDITVYSSDSKRSPGRLSRQGPAVLRWAMYEAGKTHARASAPDHAYYAAVKDRQGGKRAALSEARKILRQACHILAELGDDALTAA